MAVRGLIVLAAFLSSLVATCYGDVMLSQLPKTIVVTTSPPGRVDLVAGVNQFTVSWALNPNLTNTDTSSYRTVKLRLCYTRESQQDRPWRKSEDHLARDKTCQHDITSQPYTNSGNNYTYSVERNVPTAVYSIRALVLDASNHEVAFGNTTDDVRLSVTGITGRHTSLDIASAVFSAFSVVSLAGFFYLEKRKAKRAT